MIKCIRIVLLVFSAIVLFSSCEKIADSNQLSNEEVIAGLKEALNVATDTSVSILNKQDGYFKDALVKIFLPPEAQVIYSNLAKVPGGQKLLDDVVLSINRSAEMAAKQATPIFISAISSMTIQDGFQILNGADTAATNYLRQKTYMSLFDAFKPPVQSVLSKPVVLGMSAEQTYKNLLDAYNLASLGGLLFEQVKTNTLSNYVTDKALNGLFLKVSLQEQKIRKDPIQQVTDLLKKVFGGQK